MTTELAKEDLNYDIYAIDKIIIDCWLRVLKLESVKLNDNFFEQGGDSLLAMQLTRLLEKELALTINVAEFLKIDTISKQSDYIKRKLKIRHNPNILEFQHGEKKEKIPLILVHPLGGTLFSYSTLLCNLEKKRPVIGIQDPFFSGNLHFYSSIQETASYYIEQIETCFSDTVILGGYSSGGTIAFEMARQLIAKGKKVLHLFIFDSWAKMPFDISIKEELKKLVKRQADRLEAYRTPNFAINPEHWLEILHNRVEILMNYIPKRISINLTLFTPTEILERFSKNKCNDNGWQSYVDQVTVVQGGGNHENMLEEENVKEIRSFFIDIMKQLP